MITLVPFKPSQSLTTIPSKDHSLSMTEIGTLSQFQRLQEITPKTSIPGSLLFLGTGSALPSKYRNGMIVNRWSLVVTGMLLSHSILLDCGEGTVNQLLRVSSDKEVLSHIHLVLISHSHADHHLGLPLLLTLLASNVTEEAEYTEKRPKRPEPSLLIIGPPRVRLFLEMWSAFIPTISSVYSYLDIPITSGIHGHDHVALPPLTPTVIHSERITTEIQGDGSFIVILADQNLAFKFIPVRIDMICGH